MLAFSLKRLLEAHPRFTKIMKQPGDRRQQGDTFRTLPTMFAVIANNLQGRAIGWHAPLRVKASQIPDNPQQLGLSVFFQPVAGYGGVAACRFTQQLAQGGDAFHRYRRLPRRVTRALSKLIDNLAALLARTFGTSRDNQHIHFSTPASKCEVSCKVAIITSSASAC
ncbi:hypothetical protein G9451_02190 [Enterobacter kobei]|nr:hypothetical protein [Enterobacter kobei]MBE8914714.1 hypothetical protein [Enterobacter kobei]MCM7875535.1 hypothetical protein [Enterobacter kobei]MCW4702668.1 hypothetical protein [Enterobacter kobei]